MQGFGVPGEKLTVKVRQMFYDAIARQEIGWHDLPENTSGTLCANLASEAVCSPSPVCSRRL